jgi:hypothetical protein
MELPYLPLTLPTQPLLLVSPLVLLPYATTAAANAGSTTGFAICGAGASVGCACEMVAHFCFISRIYFDSPNTFINRIYFY